MERPRLEQVPLAIIFTVLIAQSLSLVYHYSTGTTSASKVERYLAIAAPGLGYHALTSDHPGHDYLKHHRPCHLYITTQELEYHQITLIDDIFMLHYGANDNIFAVASEATSFVDGSGVFSSLGEFVVDDSDGRVLHAYVDTMASIGISRMRLNDSEKFPNTPRLSSLAPSDNPGADPSVLVASTSAGEVFFPPICVHNAQTKLAPKLFLAKYMDAGAKALAYPKLAETLIVGKIDECAFMQWQNGESGIKLGVLLGGN
ncbi:MAG: hypothetical protein M1814_001902 [Vezdaea aestivalis]|nr:MAG: hypothetical protein M1814_001902 [Vezdaea aestivalis]